MPYATQNELISPKRIFKSVPVMKSGHEVPCANAEKSASSKAESILSSAKTESEVIVKRANDQANTVSEKARKEGFAKGQKEASQKYFETLKMMGKSLEEMESMRNEMTTDLRETIVALGLEIAGKVLRHEINIDPSTLSGIANDVLRKIAPVNEATLRVNPTDFEALKELKDEFESSAGYPEKLKISPDPSLKRGDIVVNYQRGTVDARIETQLRNIALTLMDRAE